MSGRANREYVENRVFAVSVPACAQKARLRFPTMRQKQWVAVEHPAKVDTVINASGALDDFSIVAKALTHGKDAGQQQCRVNRRDFAVPASLAGLRVEPMIKPAALIKGARVKET